MTSALFFLNSSAGAEPVVREELIEPKNSKTCCKVTHGTPLDEVFCLLFFQISAASAVREVCGVDHRQRRGGREAAGQEEDAGKHQVHRRTRKAANHPRLDPAQVPTAAIIFCFSLLRFTLRNAYLTKQ